MKLNTLVEQFQSRNANIFKDMADRIQASINTLPFANLEPQVRNRNLSYIAAGAGLGSAV